MSVKFLVPAVLVALLAGCASNPIASSTDPVRARVLADLAQARENGTYPPSEADYVTPNWIKIANPAGTLMTDGHPETERAVTVAAAPARATVVAAPAVTIMTDASSGTGKGSDSAQ
ncbi:DUF4148 domain-containing protein [Massilia sp. Leaf139]|uniref:DUF4148 domain-containing protein n=1 Tax=Massilia sp. Leaf139 TaxID=1736272 RepID=UPI0006FA2BFA|nr:DUF4148 domain-containing protein [Massilia sp. Leaf139]KQQ96913.1 hypothetical protein ASF77_02765 [Massilia sp. Leaf139]